MNGYHDKALIKKFAKHKIPPITVTDKPKKPHFDCKKLQTYIYR